jgi:hypothetical protein
MNLDQVTLPARDVARGRGKATCASTSRRLSFRGSGIPSLGNSAYGRLNRAYRSPKHRNTAIADIRITSGDGRLGSATRKRPTPTVRSFGRGK